MYNSLYERDMLFRIEESNELGSVHVKVLSPNEKGRLPIVVERKSKHSPLEFSELIINTLQKEVFERVNIDVRKNCDIYFVLNQEFDEAYKNSKFLYYRLNEDGTREFVATDEFYE